MSNAAAAAAVAYQSQLGLGPVRPISDHQQSSAALGHHHTDSALLHDYHSLWQWVAGYGYSQWENKATNDFKQRILKTDPANSFASNLPIYLNDIFWHLHIRKYFPFSIIYTPI